MNPVTMLIGQSTTATPTFVDANGAVIAPQDVPQYSVDDPSVVSVEPAADGLSALITGIAEGAATLTVTTTNERGNGATVSGTGDISVAPLPPPDVASVAVDFSDPA